MHKLMHSFNLYINMYMQCMHDTTLKFILVWEKKSWFLSASCNGESTRNKQKSNHIWRFNCFLVFSCDMLHHNIIVYTFSSLRVQLGEEKDPFFFQGWSFSRPSNILKCWRKKKRVPFNFLLVQIFMPGGKPEETACPDDSPVISHFYLNFLPSRVSI